MSGRRIGGRLDLQTLEDLAGSDQDDDRMRAFRMLTRAEQAAAIRRLAADGMSDLGIAQATCLAVEQVRRVLSQRQA
jgi:hypothetical protein